jgi:hypothetical protein
VKSALTFSVRGRLYENGLFVPTCGTRTPPRILNLPAFASLRLCVKNSFSSAPIGGSEKKSKLRNEANFRCNSLSANEKCKNLTYKQNSYAGGVGLRCLSSLLNPIQSYSNLFKGFVEKKIVYAFLKT